ncbi:MAG: transcriptional repressor [Oscillospiraceae bacterium]|nr:transcriptional repressor [Oscillospiraceae bacterium]
MSKYMTRQRKALLGCLCAHPDEQLSAQEIADALAGEEISLSAVYRNLSELEAEGKVRRSGRAGSREVYYQYIDADGCRGCLHLSCRSCGRTYHMSRDGARQLLEAVQQAEGFAVDKGETVLYGVCQRCRG